MLHEGFLILRILERYEFNSRLCPFLRRARAWSRKSSTLNKEGSKEERQSPQKVFLWEEGENISRRVNAKTLQKT